MAINYPMVSFVYDRDSSAAMLGIESVLLLLQLSLQWLL
jgi:hypothetical protein